MSNNNMIDLLDKMLDKIETMSPEDLTRLMELSKISPTHAKVYEFLERYIRFKDRGGI